MTSTGVALASGARIDAEVVIDARGTRPDTALAAAAGLTLGPTGGIAVDPWQRTSDPRILAVGDAVEKIDAVSGERVQKLVEDIYATPKEDVEKAKAALR